MINITKEQHDNLLKLANHLMNKPLKAEFTMSTFSDKPFDSKHAIDDCGTVGCAVGHATYIIEPKLQKEGWLGYSERLFGLSADSKEWSWCFSALWANIDDSPQGAAQRIIYLLTTEKVPKCYRRYNNR